MDKTTQNLVENLLNRNDGIEKEYKKKALLEKLKTDHGQDDLLKKDIGFKKNYAKKRRSYFKVIPGGKHGGRYSHMPPPTFDNTAKP